MKFKETSSILNISAAGKILLISFLYCLAIIPGKLLLLIAPGADVRFAAFIPVVAGFIWGPAGALGSAAGNFLADFYSGDSLFICFWGAVSNFFLAYLPYRLWYGVRADKAPLFICDTASCLKFFAVIFITALNFAALLTAIVTGAEMQVTHTGASLFIFFANNFSFPLLFGIPLLLLLRRSSLEFSLPPLPKTTAPKMLNNIRDSRQLQALAAATFLSVLFLLGSLLGVAGSAAAQSFLIANSLLLAFTCTLPAAYDKSALTGDAQSFYSLGARATTAFLLFAIATIVFTVTLTYTIYNLQQERPFNAALGSFKLWQTLLSTLLISSNIIFLAVIFMLNRLEKLVVHPLRHLTETARTLLASGYLEQESLLCRHDKPATNEIEDLRSSFSQMTCDICRYISDLSVAIAEKKTISAQLEIASQIQQSILPETADINVRLKNYNVTAGMFPAKEVGGDFYDCFFLDDKRLAILIADVSGKGVPAALFMMVAKALLKNNSHLGDPAKILAAANNGLCDNNSSMMFATAWLGIIDLASGRLTYANAGHNYPLLQTAGQTSHWLKERSGPALGVMPGCRYKNYGLMLPFDSKLLLYTDGITEAENSRQEFYGAQRLEQRFFRAHIPEDILFSVLEFAEGSPQSDDITFLWLSRK